MLAQRMMAGRLAAVRRGACCALVLLWLGAAVTATAAAAPEGSTAGDGRTTARQAGSKPAAQAEQLKYLPATCPDVSDGVCMTGCQVVICTALANFYNATLNSTYSPWVKQRGWPDITATDCWEQAAGKQRGALPGYCRAFGVDCCSSREAEDGRCDVVGGVTELVLEANALNGSISNPQLLSSIAQLHACGLTKLILQVNDLSGTLSSDWGNFTRLTHLNLGNNWISGTIPDSVRNLKALRQLNLGNYLHGPLPAWLSEIEDLRELRLGANLGSNGDGTKGLNGTLPAALGQLTNLQVLDVQANALSGTLPRHTCSRSSQLQMLQLRNNHFSGTLDELAGCRSLMLLDVSGNRFQGRLPEDAAGNWSQLVGLDASRNHLHGPIPSSIYHLPMLTYLTLSHNSLSGTIGRDVSLLTYLTQLKLSHNYLTGEVDEGLWTLPQMQLADLSYNYFYGTLSRMSGLTLSLNQLNLENNSLAGPLPPNMGLLRNLDRVNIRKTNLSCVPFSTRPSRPPVASGSPYTTLNNINTTPTPAVLDTVKEWAAADDSSDDDLGPYLAPTTQCSVDQLLPCFLSFSEHTVPRTDSTSMACPAILRLPHDQAVAACNGSSSWQLGPLAYSVAETVQTSEQTWDLDPSYYQFRKCVCLKGYSGTWSRNGTLLTCSPKHRDPLPTSLIMAIVAGAAGVLLLAAVGLLVWLRLAVQLRPRWQREKELDAHRKRGLPCGSPASIVVTDIEHYSTLMKLNAPLTTRALGLHNAVMRRAVATHAGHVVEQEGDSWTVAFHSPMDAVAFCLQAQQALARINWPAELIGTGTSSRLISGLSLALQVAGGSSKAQPLAAADTLSSTQARASGPATAPGAAVRPSGLSTGSHGTSWSSSIVSSSSSPPEGQTLAAATDCVTDVASGNHLPTVQQDAAVVVRLRPNSGPGQRHEDAAAAAAGGSCGLSSRRQQLLHRVLHHPQAVSTPAPAAFHDPAKQQQQQQQQKPALQCKETSSSSSVASLAGLSKANSFRSGRRSTGQQAVRPAAAASGMQEGHEAVTDSKPVQFQEAAGLEEPSCDTTGPGNNSSSNNSRAGGVLATLHSLRSCLKSRGGSKASQAGGEQPGIFRRSSSSTIREADRGLECLSGGDEGINPALRGVAARYSHLPRGHGGGSGTQQQQQQQQSRFWSMIGLNRPSAYRGGNRGGVNHQHQTHPGLKEVPELMQGGLKEVPELMQGGLKVRMGVASGWVPRDTHICRCALMQLAKAVSEMANGGQVLIDGQCFVGIRDRLAELGTVDAHGYNDKLWRDAAKAAVRQHNSGLLGCFSALMRFVGRGSGLNMIDTDALVLDMGAYFLPSLAPVLPNAAAALGDAADDAASFTAAVHLKAAQVAAAAVVDIGDAAVAVAALAVAAGSSSSSVGHGAAGYQLEHVLASSNCAELSLYCVSARSLQFCVKLWGNKLSFKEDTQQTSRAYFQAPGALLAGFDPPSSVDPPPLPLVTLVFAEVEGGRALVRRRPELARLVHTTITRLTQVLLQALPEWCGVSDGYLCREQEGDLKFMLAFREPARAAEWCLMLQEVLLYVPWPQEVLDELAAVNAGSSSPSALEAWTGGPDTNTSNKSSSKDDAAKGGGSISSACAGPAMRMGLSEGHPHSIMPDHLGRADYHGFHVNLAARLMGAAARPGQVVTTVDVAERIFSTWRYEAEASVHRNIPHCKQHQRHVDDVLSPFVASQLCGSPTCGNLAMHPAPEVSNQASGAAVHNGQEATGAAQEQGTGLQASQPRPELQQQQQQQQQQLVQDSLSVCPGQCAYVGPAQHQALQRGSRPSLWALLDSTRSANLVTGPSYPSRPIHVSCHHLGTYTFKGCGTVDVVAFLTDTIPVLEWPTADTKGAKGNLVSAASGPVVGLQDCPVPLPAVLPVLRQAWRQTELLVQAASATKVQLLHQRNATAAAAAATRGGHPWAV